jgi:hypothetical protein
MRYKTPSALVLLLIRERREEKSDLRDLADLEEVAVRIAEEAADLSTPVDRRRQEDSTTRLERLIGGAKVTVGLSLVGPPPLTRSSQLP